MVISLKLCLHFRKEGITVCVPLTWKWQACPGTDGFVLLRLLPLHGGVQVILFTIWSSDEGVAHQGKGGCPSGPSGGGSGRGFTAVLPWPGKQWPVPCPHTPRVGDSALTGPPSQETPDSASLLCEPSPPPRVLGWFLGSGLSAQASAGPSPPTRPHVLLVLFCFPS